MLISKHRRSVLNDSGRVSAPRSNPSKHRRALRAAPLKNGPLQSVYVLVKQYRLGTTAARSNSLIVYNIDLAEVTAPTPVQLSADRASRLITAYAAARPILSGLAATPLIRERGAPS